MSTKVPRLTKKDWQIINSALAWYEAEDLRDEVSDAEDPDAAFDALHDQIGITREKVWARLSRYK